MTVLALAFFANPAHAQDGIDAHNFVQASSDGEALDPLTLYHAEQGKPGVITINALFEYAANPLVLENNDGSETRLLDDLFVVNANAHFGISERVSAGIAIPVVVSAYTAGTDGEKNAFSPQIGDTRIDLALSLVGTDEPGFHLLAVPYADLGSGNPALWLGTSGLGGGILAAASYTTDSVDVTGNAGVDVAPRIDVGNLSGGASAVVGAGVGVKPTDWLGLRLEGLFRPALTVHPDAKLTESPGEVTLSARGHYDNGLNWTVGGAKSYTQGAGAADFRLFLGLGSSFGKMTPADRDKDGIADKVDACRDVPEVVNGYNDTDGCPDDLANAIIIVKDSAGQPIAGATVTILGQTLQTGPDGQVKVAGLMPGAAPYDAKAKGFLAGENKAYVLNEGTNATEIALQDAPGVVDITVTGEGGGPVAARVGFDPKVGDGPVATGDDGNEQIAVTAGTYKLDVRAVGWSPGKATVSVAKGETQRVEVTLHKPLVKVAAKEIEILQQVQFDFNSDAIKPESFGLLDEVAGVLIDNPRIKRVEVQGHTDDIGSNKANQTLSQKRVESVVKYLVDHGVEPARLVPKGYGETKPMVPNKSDANRALNRRVQFVILEQDPATLLVPVQPPGEAPPGETPPGERPPSKGSEEPATPAPTTPSGGTKPQ